MKIRFVLCLLCLAPLLAESAGVSQGYRNPIWSDIPDMGLCSDGKKYYMVSTTMSKESFLVPVRKFASDKLFSARMEAKA